MVIFAALSIACLSFAVILMTGWAFTGSFTLIAEDTTEDGPEPTASLPAPKWPYEGRHRRQEPALSLADEDREFLEAATAQPVVDRFAPLTAPTPDAWFGVPDDDTRQLTAVQ